MNGHLGSLVSLGNSNSSVGILAEQRTGTQMCLFVPKKP